MIHKRTPELQMKLSTLLAWPVICFVVLASQPVSAQTMNDANKAKLEQRDQLRQKAVQVANEGKLDEATTLCEQAYSLEESVFGPAHPELLRTLRGLAQIAQLKNDDRAVINIRKRQHRVTEQLCGKEDYRTQDAARAITTAEQDANRSPEDLARLKKATALSTELVKLHQSGQYKSAVVIGKQAVEILKAVLGEQHPNYASSLSNLAGLYDSMGDYPRAEPLFVQAMEIRKAVLGEQHPDYAISVSGLASLYRSMGDYPRAEPLFVQAMEIFKAVLGEQHPSYATSLSNLALLFQSMGDYARAESLYKQAMEIYKAVLGEQHPSYATSLNNLAYLYQSMGDYPRAEPLFVQAMEVRKAVLGEQHPDYATSLNNLATLYKSMGDYARAESLYKQAMEIFKAVLGEQHPSYVTSLNSLAYLYQSMGDYQRAEPLYVQAMEVRKAVLGEQHPDYATSLNNLATLYESMGDSARAEPLYVQAMEIRKAVLGEQHSDYATSLNSLAYLYQSMGDYQRAEPLYVQAMEIRKTVLGEQHSDYATSFNSLAYLYRLMGDYPRAEPLLVQAVEIDRAVLGEQHPSYARRLNNLALLYESMGDYPRAETLYLQALEILKATLGEQHPDYGGSLNNLAGLYSDMGDYPQAEPLFVQATEIYKAVHGEEHPRYADTMNNLAGAYHSMGDYSRAEPLYVQAMEIRKAVLGVQHPDYASSLNNLATLYESMGDYPRAAPLYLQALEILKATLGKQHPNYAGSLKNLAGLYRSMGDYPHAESRYREAVEITLGNLELTADVQSQRQQVAMSESLRIFLDRYLSMATKDLKFQPAAYAALLRWKGSVWQRQVRQRSLVDQPSLQPRFEALQAVSSKLSTLILRVPDPSQQEDWRRQLDELTDEREKLERDLSVASVAFRQASIPVTPEQLRASMPERTMLVDFLAYWHFTTANLEQQTKESYERRLLVHLMSADEEVRAIDLGDVASLNVLVQTWRQDLGQSPAAIDASRELRKRIWDPLEEHLTGITTIFVSPDGLLGQFPLAALPGKQPGSYLLEEMAIVMLPVPQGLPAMATTTAPSTDSTNDRFCLVGGVDYEQVTAPDTSTSPTTPAAPAGPLMLAARGGQWQAFGALPGTAAEIDTIESLIRTHHVATQTTILRGGMASEAAFTRNAPGNRYLHIATHGFFAPETVQNAMTASAKSTDRMLADSESRAPKLVGQHPDLLSGLVFAGANRKPDSDTENDGILTAAEVQSLDLRGVDLAVLSACETGLGKTAGGEGIIGLQRAFQLAGAKTTITSLWKVDDAATQALMVEFYRNLFERKLSKLESLRQAQLWLLNHPEAIDGRDLTTRGSVRPINITTETKTTADKPTRSLPAYWAAFQLSGDPR